MPPLIAVGRYGGYGLGPDENAIKESKDRYTEHINDAAKNMSEELDRRSEARQGMITEMARRQIEVSPFGLSPGLVGEGLVTGGIR